MWLFQGEEFQRLALAGLFAVVLSLGLASAIPGAHGVESRTDPVREHIGR